MIPKIIFQTCIYKPCNFQIETIQKMAPGWEYKHFIDSEIINFIKENPISEFENSIQVFNSLNGAHKADFFRYYYLYLNGGVYIDSDARLESDINKITEGNSFFTVKSAIENCKIFNGFIATEPKNKIIYESLKWIYINYSNIKEYFEICRNMDTNYQLHKTEKDLLFTEKIIGKIAKTFDNNGEHVLTHYFTDKIIEPNIDIQKKCFKNSLKIGITFNLPKRFVDLYCCGINQHTLFFGELLLNIGQDIYFIIPENCLEECTELNQILYDPRFKIAKYMDILTYDFDILFDFGFSVDPNIYDNLKLSGTKIIAHKCGNEFIINTEDIIYNLKRDKTKRRKCFNYDQIWSIPQMMNTNKYYWETLHRTKCIEAPFIWSNKLISKEENKFLFKKRPGEKNVAIMEPNLSLMKCAIPPIIICENAYRNCKNIKKLYITNIAKDNKNQNFDVERLTLFVNDLDLRKDNKISVEPRVQSLSLMAEHGIDIAVSHQWENPLNYLYLDLAWMGWPIVHNAHLCKDVGYYYPEFNYEEGGNVLSEVIENHDLRSEEYIASNRRIIDRYLPSNKILQGKYKKMFKELYSN